MPDSTPLSPLRLLLVGPTSPAGEQLIEQLSEGPRPPALVGADVGDAVGGEYEWRGESETVLDLDSVAQDTFDVVVLAVPVGPRRLPRAGHVLLLPGAGREGRVVLHGLTDPPGAGERVRLPDPVACLVATLVQVLSAAAQVRGVEVVTFESASALGRAGMDELRDQTIDLLNFREPRALVFSRRLAFDTLQRGPGSESDFIQDFNELLPGLAQSAARMLVPAFVGVVVAVRLAVEAEPDVRALQRLLEADPRFLVEEAVGLSSAVDEDRIVVTPPRLASGVLHLWLAADDTRAGSAVPAAHLLRGR
jgi:hypothetical protein